MFARSQSVPVNRFLVEKTLSGETEEHLAQVIESNITDEGPRDTVGSQTGWTL